MGFTASVINNPAQVTPMVQNKGSYYSTPFGQPANPQNQSQRSWSAERLKDYGYDIDSRPFDFDASQWNNPYAAQQQQMIAQGNAYAKNRQTPAMDLTDSNQARAAQMGNYANVQNQYQGVLNGTQPSLAQQQLQQGMDTNLQNAMAMAVSRGGSRGANIRGAAYQAGQQGQAMAGQAAMLRSQELNDARSGLLNVAQGQGGVRTTDAGIAGQQQQAQLAQQQMNDQLTQYYTSQGLNLQQAQWQANMDLQQQMAQQHTSAQSIKRGVGAPAQQSKGAQYLGAGLSAAAGIGAMFLSDKTKKTKIESATAKIHEFFDSYNARKIVPNTVIA